MSENLDSAAALIDSIVGSTKLPARFSILACLSPAATEYASSTYPIEFSVPDTKLETPSLRSALDPTGQVTDLPLPI
jgi:hypothetical protein